MYRALFTKFTPGVNPQIMHFAGWLVELVDFSQTWSRLCDSQVKPTVKKLMNKGLLALQNTYFENDFRNGSYLCVNIGN